jgi:hypothetical protein
MANSNFASWYYSNEGKKVDITQAPAERKFFDVVGVKIPSLKSFISWLILKKHITNLIEVKGERPLALISLPAEKKIAALVKNIKNIKDLALEYNKAFGNIENGKLESMDGVKNK